MQMRCGWLEMDEAVDALPVVEQIADATGATIQAFDARYVIGPAHLERAVELADRAIERDASIADDRAVEILLYAAGRRQINRAMQMGLKEEDHPVAVVIDGGDTEHAVDEIEGLFRSLIDCDGSLADEALVRDFFDIGEAELSTGAGLYDLVLERVALLSIDR